MVSTRGQVHPLSSAHMPGTWKAHPLKRTCSALHTCLAHGKRTRSGAPAQHCAHAWHMARAPAQVHPLSTAHMSGTWSAHPLKRTRSAMHTCLAHVSTPAPVRRLAHGKQPAQARPLCTHAWHMVCSRLESRDWQLQIAICF